MATVWTTMEKDGNGRFSEAGFHLQEPATWYRYFSVEDPEEFILHMRRFASIPKKPLSRERYEELCRHYAVTPNADTELDIYGTTLSTMGTSNYQLHVEPDKRELVIANTLHDLRYRKLRRENNL